MQWAKNLKSKDIIDLEDTFLSEEAIRVAQLVCPECQEPVTLHVRKYGKHFQHNWGAGTDACDLYQPRQHSQPTQLKTSKRRISHEWDHQSIGREVDLSFIVKEFDQRAIVFAEATLKPQAGLTQTGFARKSELLLPHFNGQKKISQTSESKTFKLLRLEFPFMHLSRFETHSEANEATVRYIHNINTHLKSHSVFPLTKNGEDFTFILETQIFLEDVGAILRTSNSGLRFEKVALNNQGTIEEILIGDRYEVLTDKPAAFYTVTPNAIGVDYDGSKLKVTSLDKMVIHSKKEQRLTVIFTGDYELHQTISMEIGPESKELEVPPLMTNASLVSQYQQRLDVISELDGLSCQTPVSFPTTFEDEIHFTAANENGIAICKDNFWKIFVTSSTLFKPVNKSPLSILSMKEWNKKILCER